MIATLHRMSNKIRSKTKLGDTFGIWKIYQT